MTIPELIEWCLNGADMERWHGQRNRDYGDTDEADDCEDEAAKYEAIARNLERVAVLEAALEHLERCEQALRSLPADALGVDARLGYPYRDELIDAITNFRLRVQEPSHTQEETHA